MKVLWTTLFLTSCGSVRHMALNTLAPMVQQVSGGLEAEGNWKFFSRATPGNLQLIDGLLSIRPKNPALLASAIKGYAGYAFAVFETLYLADKLAEKDESPHRQTAISLYTKAINYGVRFLGRRRIHYADLQKAVRSPDGLAAWLDARLAPRPVNLEAVLFTAQALASSINLQKGNIALVGELPVAKGLFDWVCDKDPGIALGACQIFAASYEAGRPSMLGGNPGKARKIFEELIAERPHNWMVRTAYLEHYIIPRENRKLYRRQMAALEKFGRIHRDKMRWSPGQKPHPAFGQQRLRLYQAIAIKRFEIIKKHEPNIF